MNLPPLHGGYRPSGSRLPFERLVELVEIEEAKEPQVTLGVLASRLGESVERIMDAIDAGKMIRKAEWRAQPRIGGKS